MCPKEWVSLTSRQSGNGAFFSVHRIERTHWPLDSRVLPRTFCLLEQHLLERELERLVCFSASAVS